MTDANAHHRRTVAEFSAKVESYAQSPEINDAAALRLLATLAGVEAGDDVLDIACGPGVVACDLARRARRVTGVDLTPAMLAKARELATREGLRNLSWAIADAASLPFADGAFSLVVSRYAVHHVEDPAGVLVEMRRVCTPTGRLAVVDVCLPDDAELAARFNRVERLRDPSHVRARTDRELRELFARAGLATRAERRYTVDFELEQIIAFSSASDAEKDEIRAAWPASFRHRDGSTIRAAYPICAFALERC